MDKFNKNAHCFEMNEMCDEFYENDFDETLEEDENLRDYYNKIAAQVDAFLVQEITENPTNRFYIHRKKAFYADGNKYYELTLSTADDKTSKFDRFIAFTKLDIPTFYAVHLRLKPAKINIINRDMPIKIIVGFMVSVRPCEFDNYFKLLGHTTSVKTKNPEYKALMAYLTQSKRNLTELLKEDEEDFINLKNLVCKDITNTPIFDGIAKARGYDDMAGFNVLTYLLYRLQNKVLKNQFDLQNPQLSNLYLSNGCIPFDKMPFAANLPKHSTKFFDLMDCINHIGRAHELLARKIRKNTETKGQLYTPISQLSEFTDIETLIEIYNSKLYEGHLESGSLKMEDGFVFMTGYENNSCFIIEELMKLSNSGVDNHRQSAENWLKDSSYLIDDTSKRKILCGLFEKSNVALVYGSAGTGKSTMIKHISKFFADSQKIFLANTHAAVQNMKRIVGTAETNTFSTIRKFLLSGINHCDILIIDEASTVSNEDMARIIKQTKYQSLVLVGDIHQIESIKFGNWFYIAKSCLPSHCIHELSYVHRSANPDLLNLWNTVRNLDNGLPEMIEAYNFSSSFDESIFTKAEDDEIVLCLNYDGLYGINNLNKFLQDNQSGKSVQIGVEQYRVGDPIVFKENERYGHILYNNLKGKILDMSNYDGGTKFTLEVNLPFEDLQDENLPFVLEAPAQNNKSVISLKVGRFVNTDDEDRTDDHIVPFQVAYAVSIHKAQGLEYNSVKIIISDSVEDLISHNIFYTAITRAKQKLKIFWTQKTKKHILANMHLMFNNRDAQILLNKLFPNI